MAASSTTTSTTTAVFSNVMGAMPIAKVLPYGARLANRPFRYCWDCGCADCFAHFEGRLYYRHDYSIVPADCLTRSVPHDYGKLPPKPNTDAWRERQERGSNLLRGLLSGEQLKVWDRFRALIIRYYETDTSGLCDCDNCNGEQIAGLLLMPENKRDLGRWEFNDKGGLLHRRNLWALESDTWSYEDELISLLLAHRADPVVDFIETGCRDRASYYCNLGSYKRAARTMRRIGRFQEATKVPFATTKVPFATTKVPFATTKVPFAKADQAGMFAGIY